MHRRFVRYARLILALMIVWTGLVACGGSTAGDPVTGELLYNGQTLSDPNLPTCISCHPVQPGEAGNIGNNLSNIGNRAAVTVPDQTAEEYLRTSIVEPDVYLAGGFQEGIHYRGYKEALTQQQINDLVAYMLTLKSGQD